MGVWNMKSKRYPNVRCFAPIKQHHFKSKDVDVKFCRDVCKECHNTKEGDRENFKYMACWDRFDDNFWEIGYVRCRVANRVVLIHENRPENCPYHLEHILGMDESK